MAGLRLKMNDALLELVYDDPLNSWTDIPVLELSGPLDGRLNAVLAMSGRRPFGQADPSQDPRDETLGPGRVGAVGLTELSRHLGFFDLDPP